MHKLLERQLRKHFHGESTKEFQELLGVISQNYEQSDHDHELIERSLELTSKEFNDLNHKLKKEKEFSEKLVDTVQAIIVGLDKNHKIVLFNKGAEKITGYKAREVIGKDWFKLFFNKNILKNFKLKVVWERAWNNPFDKNVNPIITKEGNELLIQWSTSNINFGRKDQLQISVGFDITKQKMSEIALKESENKFKQIFNQTKNGLILIDKKFKIRDVNKTVLDATGFTKKQLLGKNVLSTHPKEWYKTRTKNINATFKGKIMTCTCPYLTIKNKLIPAETILSSVIINNEKMVLITFNDITERKKVQDALKESEENLRLYHNVINQSFDAVFIIDANTSKFIDVNEQAIKSTGYSRKELLKMSVLELEAKIPTKNVWKKLVQKLKKERGMLMPGVHKRKNGTQFPVEISISYTKQEGKKYLVAIVRNLSQRKKMEYELSERMKEITALYSITKTATQPNITADNVIKIALEDLPQGFQWPEKACARATFKGREYKSNNCSCKPTKWSISSDIKLHGKILGSLTVHYTEKLPFLKEEQDVLDAVSDTIGMTFEKTEAENNLREKVRELESLNKFMIGREKRIIELKERISLLEKKYG